MPTLNHSFDVSHDEFYKAAGSSLLAPIKCYLWIIVSKYYYPIWYVSRQIIDFTRLNKPEQL
jgi:hypothetical protein